MEVIGPHSRLEFGAISYRNGGFVGKVFSVILTYPAWWRQHADLKQDAQLSQRDRAAGCVIVFAKSRRMELGDNIFMDIIGLSSTTVIQSVPIENPYAISY